VLLLGFSGCPTPNECGMLSGLRVISVHEFTLPVEFKPHDKRKLNPLLLLRTAAGRLFSPIFRVTDCWSDAEPTPLWPISGPWWHYDCIHRGWLLRCAASAGRLRYNGLAAEAITDATHVIVRGRSSISESEWTPLCIRCDCTCPKPINRIGHRLVGVVVRNVDEYRLMKVLVI